MLHFVYDAGFVLSNGRKKKKAVYSCDCGEKEERYKDNVSKENDKFCMKCNSKKRIKKLPSKINGIKVLEDLGMSNKSKPKRMARFECECGKDFTGTINAIKSEQLRSCGCLKNKDKITHNLSKHRLYRKWSGMITRTTNKKDSHYKSYGGKGVVVCDDWRNDFLSFYNWAINNGYRKGLTIDRIDVNGNYEPLNCQWITMRENTLKDRRVEFLKKEKSDEICSRYKEEHITITELAKQYKTNKRAVSNILKDNKIKIENRRLKR